MLLLQSPISRIPVRHWRRSRRHDNNRARVPIRIMRCTEARNVRLRSTSCRRGRHYNFLLVRLRNELCRRPYQLEAPPRLPDDLRNHRYHTNSRVSSDSTRN